MQEMTNYIRPELMALAAALYAAGMGLKGSSIVKDKWIPLILGAAGIVLSGVWVFANTPVTNGRQAAMAVFTSVVQGILAAGVSTYVNQIIKQGKKEE